MYRTGHHTAAIQVLKEQSENYQQVGYAFYLAHSKEFQSQLLELQQAGCEKMFTDVTAARFGERPQRQLMMGELNENSLVIVSRLSCLGANRRDLIHVVNQLIERKATLHCLQHNFTFQPASLLSQLRISALGLMAERDWKYHRFQKADLNLDERDLLDIGARLFIEGHTVPMVAKEYDLNPQIIRNNEEQIVRTCFEVWGCGQSLFSGYLTKSLPMLR